MHSSRNIVTGNRSQLIQSTPAVDAARRSAVSGVQGTGEGRRLPLNRSHIRIPGNTVPGSTVREDVLHGESFENENRGQSRSSSRNAVFIDTVPEYRGQRARFASDIRPEPGICYSRSGGSQRNDFSQEKNSRVHCARRSVPVVQWSLKYSGEGGGISLNEFLSKVRFHMRARHVSEDELLDSAYDLFSGAALNWYEANYDKFNSWPALENSLKLQFLPYDYDVLLCKEIEERTQGSEERIGIYLAVMENLFRRLTYQVTEEEKLSIILRNLQPYYSEKLCFQEIGSIQQLTSLCARIEESRYRVLRFKAPPTARHNLLEPSLAYRQRSFGKVNVCENEAMGRCQEQEYEQDLCAIERNLRSRSGSIPVEAKSYRCYNCGKSGHAFRDCREPKSSKLSCSKCGSKDKVTAECVVCLKERIAALEMELKQVQTRDSSGMVAEVSHEENCYAELK